MKYLSDYMEKKQTALFNECGAFFAFSMKQYNEGKKEGKKYVDMGSGMFCEKEHVEKLINGLDKIYKDAIEQDIMENGSTGIIKRELANHEAYYDGDWTRAYNALKAYPFSIKNVKNVYYENIVKEQQLREV